ncbi:uracil DNA glycosylase [Apophysomyces sp. BC1034]|nr:uracil DNA glycosylase [Apophysomyces sp. BC1034]
MSKRPLAENNENGKTKKPTTTATRQTSLLSMFKPLPPKNDKPTETATSTAVAATSSVDLFKGVDKDTLALLDLEITTLRYEWLKVLRPELTKPYFVQLKQFLKAEADAKKTIFPPACDIYSWSNLTPPSQVKVVILGQDPYHNVNQAHGLCFSVRKDVRIPPSLVNIYEALSRDYADFKKPKHGYLEDWAKQGVLLLNTSLTVRAHDAGSHANRGWEKFTDAVIQHLNEKKANIVFLLWGAHAQKKGAKINGSNGREEIDWNCLTD